MIKCESTYGGEKEISKDKFIFRPSVYASIVKDEKILMLRCRSNGKFWLPGGGVELCERLDEALKREVREETGLEVEIEHFITFRENFFYYDPSDEAFHAFLFFYKCRPLTFDLLENNKINDGEAHSPEWISLDDIKDGKFDGEINKKLLEILKNNL